MATQDASPAQDTKKAYDTAVQRLQYLKKQTNDKNTLDKASKDVDDANQANIKAQGGPLRMLLNSIGKK